MQSIIGAIIVNISYINFRTSAKVNICPSKKRWSKIKMPVKRYVSKPNQHHSMLKNYTSIKYQEVLSIRFGTSAASMQYITC